MKTGATVVVFKFQLGSQAEVVVVMQTSMWLHQKLTLPLPCGFAPIWFFNAYWFKKHFTYDDAIEEGVIYDGPAVRHDDS